MTGRPGVEDWEVWKFLTREARLLDDRRWEDWLRLWHPDGIYWVPVDPALDGTGADALNHIYDDLPRLRNRITRLTSAGAHTEEPPPRTSRVLGLPLRIEGGGDGDTVRFETSFVLAAHRQGRVRSWAGRYEYTLRQEPRNFAILGKRIDLLDADSPLPPLPNLL